jgi:hypothetical protein
MSNMLDLRRRLAAVSPGGVRKCKSSAEQECRERAISDVERALELSGVSQREWARLCDRDESIIREWLTMGRKTMPFWAIRRLPKAARALVLDALIGELESGSLPPTGTE